MCGEVGGEEWLKWLLNNLKKANIGTAGIARIKVGSYS